MKTSFASTVAVGAILASLIFTVPVATAQPPGGNPFYNRAEVNGCWSCHERPYAYAGHDHMKYVAETWLESGHANSWSQAKGNTYCSQCHAPVQADPAATPEDNESVSISESMAVTCASCHFDHTTASFLGTRTGSLVVGSLWWDPAANGGDGGLVGVPNTVEDPPGSGNVVHEYEGEWAPLVFEGEGSNFLCENCHNDEGPHLGKKKILWEMREHGVQCVDCHMPKVPVIRYALGEDGDDETDVDVRMTRMHDFGFPHDDAGALEFKATFSCGTQGVGCHADESTEWAVEVIESGLIHEAPMDVAEVLAFMDDAVFVEETLFGTGGASSGYNLWILRFLLVNADLLIEEDNTDLAFWYLVYAYAACDGQSFFLEDLVEGPAAPELNGMILEALAQLPLPPGL